jgi:hypothetical protein
MNSESNEDLISGVYPTHLDDGTYEEKSRFAVCEQLSIKATRTH